MVHTLAEVRMRIGKSAAKLLQNFAEEGSETSPTAYTQAGGNGESNTLLLRYSPFSYESMSS